jgi:hypothetical protein
MSDSSNSPKTNVIWIVPRDHFCAKCGYAITTSTRKVNEYYSEATAYHDGHGYVHMQCPGQPWFPPVAKRADIEKES